MRCTNTAAGVAVKVLVKQNIILEIRIGGELRVIFEHGALFIFTL
jgi:hypothetical protein